MAWWHLLLDREPNRRFCGQRMGKGGAACAGERDAGAITSRTGGGAGGTAARGWGGGGPCARVPPPPVPGHAPVLLLAAAPAGPRPPRGDEPRGTTSRGKHD